MVGSEWINFFWGGGGGGVAGGPNEWLLRMVAADTEHVKFYDVLSARGQKKILGQPTRCDFNRATKSHHRKVLCGLNFTLNYWDSKYETKNYVSSSFIMEPPNQRVLSINFLSSNNTYRYVLIHLFCFLKLETQQNISSNNFCVSSNNYSESSASASKANPTQFNPVV